MSYSKVANAYAGEVYVGFVVEWQQVCTQFGGGKDFGVTNGLGNIQDDTVATLVVVFVK